jgi:hypothetical protein
MGSFEQICKELEAFYKSTYAAAFGSEDVAAIGECWSYPCALITGEQGLYQFATGGDFRGMVGKLLADLKDRGWVRSEINQLKTWPLAEDLAMMLVDGTRYKADGSVLERVRALYTVRLDNKSWRIVTLSEVKPPFLGPGDLPR